MYHSHVHNASQELMGLTGMFISRGIYEDPVHRDYVLLLQEWAVKTGNNTGMAMNHGAMQGTGMERQMMPEMSGNQMKISPGIYDIDPMAVDFNFFTINGKAYPDTAKLQVRYGERVRIRLGNLSMDSHPMHFHGHDFLVTAIGGSAIPKMPNGLKIPLMWRLARHGILNFLLIIPEIRFFIAISRTIQPICTLRIWAECYRLSSMYNNLKNC